MMENGMSVADVAALSNNDGFGGTGGWLWFLIVMFAIWGGGFGNFGNRSEQYATSAEVQRGFDNQNIMQRFDTISQNQTSAAYENANLINKAIYDNAQLINQNTVTGMQNTFGITSAINTGFDSVNGRISDLAHQMEQCCCSLKTQMLQDKYDDLRNEYNLSTMANANAVQTQNILGAIGNWYAKPPYAPYYYGGTTYGTTL